MISKLNAETIQTVPVAVALSTLVLKLNEVIDKVINKVNCDDDQYEYFTDSMTIIKEGDQVQDIHDCNMWFAVWPELVGEPAAHRCIRRKKSKTFPSEREKLAVNLLDELSRAYLDCVPTYFIDKVYDVIKRWRGL